jgi:gamma-glutamylcyclotransferase (GGCT)/AIG2-like uncharacterized protein YtfP
MYMTKIFVYGTLRKGRHNHYLIDEHIQKGSAKFVATGKTVEKYPMIIASMFVGDCSDHYANQMPYQALRRDKSLQYKSTAPYHVPFVLDRAGVGNHILGEIYEVSPDALAVCALHLFWYDEDDVDFRRFA